MPTGHSHQRMRLVALQNDRGEGETPLAPRLICGMRDELGPSEGQKGAERGPAPPPRLGEQWPSDW